MTSEMGEDFNAWRAAKSANREARKRIAELEAARQRQAAKAIVTAREVEMIDTTKLALAPGETLAGYLSGTDGRIYALIVLPGLFCGDHSSAAQWAEYAGGDLMDRAEGALSFRNIRAEFEPGWYWTKERHEHNSDCFWSQSFDGGYQDRYLHDLKLRARAVRRVWVTDGGAS